MNKFGIQITEPYDLTDDVRYHIRRIRPNTIKYTFVGGVNPSKIKELRNLSPESFWILRSWGISERQAELQANPIGEANAHASFWRDQLPAIKSSGLAYEDFIVLGNNEPGVATDREIQNVVQYNVHFASECAGHGIRPGLFNVSTDNPRANDWATLLLPLRDAALVNKGVILVHEYCSQYGVDHTWPWHMGRLLQYCSWRDVPFIIGECGVEARVIDPNIPRHMWGYQSYMSDQQYWNMLKPYQDRMATGMPNAESYSIFTLGGVPGHWSSLNYEGMLKYQPANNSFSNMMEYYGDGPVQPPGQKPSRRIIDVANANQVMQFNPSAALQKAIRAAGYWPNSPEFFYDEAGVSYVAQRAEDPASGTVRTYYVPKGQWDKVGYITH